MAENLSNFISVHNANISNPILTATLETLSAFALSKNIDLAEISIEKHRMPYINWCTGLPQEV